MERSFHETLALLRRRRGLNQRQAAAELGISQALLSHYENGTREPGLAFVCRACDFYGVSADYMLCRTEDMNAAASAAETALGYFSEMRGLLDRASMAVSAPARGETYDT